MDGANGQDSTSDDEFDRAIRALTNGTAAEPRFREPSAADREKQARRQARRRLRDGRKTGRSRGRVKQAGSRVTTAVLVAGLVAGAAWYAIREFKGTGRPAAAPPTAVSPATSPAASPAAPPAVQGPPADPFAGKTPDSWADGAAGIVLPAAKPVGSYSKATVAAAYATVKKLLIDGELTKSVLLGGRPAAFALLLPAEERKAFLDGLSATGENKDGTDKSTRDFVTAFAPDSTRLIGTVIKVHGRMTATTGVKFGDKVLHVHVNYLFAYAVEPPGQPAKWMRLVVHRTDDFYFAHWDGSTGPLLPWVESDYGQTPVLCAAADGYVHPDFAKSSSSGKGSAIDPYSLNENSALGCDNAQAT